MNSGSQNFPHHFGALRERLLHPTDYEPAFNYFLEDFADDVAFVRGSEPETDAASVGGTEHRCLESHWRYRSATASGERGRVTQAGIRPAVILQEDQATAALPTVLIVPFTSSQATLRFPGTLSVQPDGQNGLTVPSVALVFQLTTIDKANCLQALGVLDPVTLDQIFAELDKLTGR